MKHHLSMLCVFGFVLWQAAAASHGASGLPADFQAPDDPTWRFPIMTIPKVERAPTVDGVVDEADWAEATLLPPMLEVFDPIGNEGVAPDMPARVWLCYTDEAVYVAFRQTLPPEELPAADNNSFYFLISPDLGRRFGQYWEKFDIRGYAGREPRQRRHDDGSAFGWSPDVERHFRRTDTGWEGEMKIPFTELEMPGAPEVGTEWHVAFWSQWYGVTRRSFNWPYVQWRGRDEHATMVFGGEAPGVRFTEGGVVEVTDPDAAQVETMLLHRERPATFYFRQVRQAVAQSEGDDATFQPFDQIISNELATFEPTETTERPGEYLLRYNVTHEGRVVARGAHAWYVAAPIEYEIVPYFLEAQKLAVNVRSSMPEVARIRSTLETLDRAAEAEVDPRGHARTLVSTEGLDIGTHRLRIEALDDAGTVVKTLDETFERPSEPLWWTLDEGREPRVPEPWHPVRAADDSVEVLGRTYRFTAGQPVPSSIDNWDQPLLAAPMTFQTAGAWENVRFEKVEEDEEAVVFESENTAGSLNMKATTRVEFDGFMIVDLALTGEGTLDELELVIPFEGDSAILTMSHWRAPGPGGGQDRGRSDAPQGYMPEEGFVAAPTATTWIGHDHGGLELTNESTRGWAMDDPEQALEVRPEGDRMVLRAKMVSRPIELSDEPRRIRFGLVATPTKTILPHISKLRLGDDMTDRISPSNWSGGDSWHPPITDEQQLEETRDWVRQHQDVGRKRLVEGGWHISTRDPGWDHWGWEMIRSLPQTTIYDQYISCYNSPYGRFMVNSFAYNARETGFDGIRFDTVTPGATCDSLVHDGCGWHDDDGNLWPSFSIFAQREIWKGLYRVFHGGVVDEGVLFTPIGGSGGPIMAVHSFTDFREVAEGFFQTAPDLKTGYESGYARANMSGTPYGYRSANNVKFGPMLYNERVGALLVHNADPRGRFNWKGGYEAHGLPVPAIWDAWDWVKRFEGAEFRGWWENDAVLHIDADDAKVLGSFHHHRDQRRLLLVVTNYEPRPLRELPVQLDLAALGFDPDAAHAEDAITLEPVNITSDGTMQLNLFAQRYRLIRVSQEPASFRDEVLGENLLPQSPGTLSEAWRSEPIALEPNARYALSAMVKIDEPMDGDGDTPNVMGRFSPNIFNYVTLSVRGEGVTGLAGATRKSVPEEPYAWTAEYRRNYPPQWWEPTGGWVRLFVPLQTGETVDEGRVVIGQRGEGAFEIRDLTLRKVRASE